MGLKPEAEDVTGFGRFTHAHTQAGLRACCYSSIASSWSMGLAYPRWGQSLRFEQAQTAAGPILLLCCGAAQVVATVVACLPGLLVSLVGDSINNVLSGCIKGAGRQALGSLVNLLAFWCFGLPLAALFALQLSWGATGLWWAMAVTSSVQAVVLGCVVAWLDWGREVDRVKLLVRSQSRSSGGGGVSSDTQAACSSCEN